MKRIARSIVVMSLAAGVLSTTGCIVRTPIAGSERAATSESVPLGDATAVDATVELRAGELVLGGEELGQDAMRVVFAEDPDTFASTVDSSVDGSVTVYRVEQSKAGETPLLLEGVHSRWDVSVANDVPTRLTVRMGAGDGELDLRGVELDEFVLEQGAGDVDVDLSEQVRPLSGKVTLGAGELTVRLPANVPVRVTGAQDGVGEWNHDGFSEADGALLNAAAADSAPVIVIDIQRGVGEVNLELVP